MGIKTGDGNRRADEVATLLMAVGTSLSAGDEDRSFTELGVDSLARIEISKRVEGRFGVDIETQLGEDTTPAVLRSIIDGLASGVDAHRRGAEPARTKNSIEIAAPIGFVWDCTIDVRSWPELFTEYASVEVLAETPNSVDFRLTMHPDENGKVWSWVSRRRWNPDSRTVRAWRLERGPFEFMRLRWNFEELSTDRTRMTWVQEFRMKPDAPLDDAGMTARLNKNSATQMSIIAHRIEARRSAVQDWESTQSVRARGGDMRTLIAPRTPGAAFGISGFVELAPGERVREHYHPYSEEHLLLIDGQVNVDIDGVPKLLLPRQALLVPRNVRHKVRNTGDRSAVLVFALSPLAPRPDLGHVDTEETTGNGRADNLR